MPWNGYELRYQLLAQQEWTLVRQLSNRAQHAIRAAVQLPC